MHDYFSDGNAFQILKLCIATAPIAKNLYLKYIVTHVVLL